MKITVFVGTSLDGFIARPDGGLDFLEAGDNESHGFEELLASVDALVMGRRTYEIVLEFGVWPYGAKPVFVLSSREITMPTEEANVERLSGNPGDIVADLGDRGIEHIYLDGGATIQQFLRAGLVQRLIITRIPVLIGAGIALFGELEHDVTLRHITTRSFKSGLVQSEYEIVA